MEEVERVRDWVDRLEVFISALDDIEGEKPDGFCENACEAWKDIVSPDPPPPTSPAMVLIVETFGALAQVMTTVTMDYYDTPDVTDRMTRDSAQAALSNALDGIRRDGERWLDDGLPSPEEIEQRIAAVGAGMKAALEAGARQMEADNYRHPKCYANTYGGCSTKISGEHYVSLGLIKLYGGNDPDFTIQHKTGKGVGHPVTPKNFKANILCQKHNTALSPADDAALAFASFLRRNALQYDAGAGEWGDAEEITISGDDMQRWVLKLFLNHAVTGHFSEQQDRTVTFPPEAIDLLLNRAAWPSEWGLTVPGELGRTDVRCCPFQTKDVVDSHWWGVAPFVHKDKTWMGGGVVDLAHVSFGLTLFNPGRGMPGWNNPENTLHGSLQRPGHIGWELNGVEKRINFTWNDPWPHHGITYMLRPQNKADRLAGKLPVGQHIWLE